MRNVPVSLLSSATMVVWSRGQEVFRSSDLYSSVMARVHGQDVMGGTSKGLSEIVIIKLG